MTISQGSLDNPVQLDHFQLIRKVHWDTLTHVAVSLIMPQRQTSGDIVFYAPQECDPFERTTLKNFDTLNTLSSITYRYTLGDTFGRRKNGTWGGTAAAQFGGFVGHQTLAFDQWASPGPIFGTVVDDLCRFAYDSAAPLAIELPDRPDLFFNSATTARAEYVGPTIYGGPYCAGDGSTPPPYFLALDEDLPLTDYGHAAIEALSVTVGGTPWTLKGVQTIPHIVAPNPQTELGFITVDASKLLWLLFAKDA